MIDLHSHTTASDGQHPPTVLIDLAHQAGIKHLAVTDHDTLAGLQEATAKAKELGIELVCGIELSVCLGEKELHILGHFVQPKDPKLSSWAEKLKTERADRMAQMVGKMNELGYPVTMKEVLSIAGDGHLARPHLARALVEKGFCQDTKEAFARFLGDGKPAWVGRYKLSAQDGIGLIREAGGAATLAHPAVSKAEGTEIAALKEAGLSGLEVHHSDHSATTRKRLLDLAKQLDLVPTAGSDFHGEKVAPARKLGSASMDPKDFDALRSRCRA